MNQEMEAYNITIKLSNEKVNTMYDQVQNLQREYGEFTSNITEAVTQ